MSEISAKPANVASSLEEKYAAALQEYLAGEGENALHRAYEIGRQALSSGMGLLEVAALHHSALARAWPRQLRPEEVEQTLRSANQLFAETLSPYEMGHRGFREANVALRQMNEVLEQEARRIAHTLHDEMGQFLVAVHLALSNALRDLGPAQRGSFEEVKDLLRQMEELLRRLARELRPTVLDNLGLVPALRLLIEGVSKRSNLPVTLEAESEERLPPALETALYRIVQEALTNVGKHSRATAARVRLEGNQHFLCCSIQDNGVGFDVSAALGVQAPSGLGLIGIRERVNALGGAFQVKSAPGRGTELSITIPMEV